VNPKKKTKNKKQTNKQSTPILMSFSINVSTQDVCVRQWKKDATRLTGLSV